MKYHSETFYFGNPIQDDDLLDVKRPDLVCGGSSGEKCQT
jgi:hypothetical protein